MSKFVANCLGSNHNTISSQMDLGSNHNTITISLLCSLHPPVRKSRSWYSTVVVRTLGSRVVLFACVCSVGDELMMHLCYLFGLVMDLSICLDGLVMNLWICTYGFV